MKDKRDLRGVTCLLDCAAIYWLHQDLQQLCASTVSDIHMSDLKGQFSPKIKSKYLSSYL